MGKKGVLQRAFSFLFILYLLLSLLLYCDMHHFHARFFFYLFSNQQVITDAFAVREVFDGVLCVKSKVSLYYFQFLLLIRSFLLRYFRILRNSFFVYVLPHAPVIPSFVDLFTPQTACRRRKWCLDQVWVCFDANRPYCLERNEEEGCSRSTYRLLFRSQYNVFRVEFSLRFAKQFALAYL